MSKELMWLTLTVILTGSMWVPYILDRIMVRGADGRHGQPVAQRQAAIALGAAALLRAHQCRRKPRHLRATRADPRRTGYSTEGTVIRLRSLFLGAARARHRLFARHSRAAHACFRVGFLAQAALVLAIFGRAGALILRTDPAFGSAKSPQIRPRARQHARRPSPRGSVPKAARLAAATRRSASAT